MDAPIGRALILLIVASLACEATPPGTATDLLLDACDGSDCALSFGDVNISTRETRSIRVTNPSNKAVTIRTELGGSSVFSVDLVPTTLGVGMSADIVLSARPIAENDFTATLSVTSGGTRRAVALSVTGVDNGLPDIEVTPPACDFGSVALGAAGFCDVEVTNRGNRELVLEGFSIEDSSSPGFAFAAQPPGLLDAIDPGASATLHMRFAPDEVGGAGAALRIRSSDPDEDDATLDVPLLGAGVTSPVCRIGIESVNGAPYAAQDIAPGDDVVLTLGDSSAAAGVADYAWHLVQRPGFSRTVLTDTATETTGFVSGDVFGTDAAGIYCAAGGVTDTDGVSSANACTVCFEARFKADLVVELRWDTPDNDLDLHVTREDSTGNFCVTNNSGDPIVGLLSQSCANGADCNFATCQQGSGPEWDGALGFTAGDPTLELDDINGLGPERTRIDAMVPGNILIGVNEYAGTSEYEALATLQVFVRGTLAAEFERELDVGDWWEVALIQWPDLADDAVCIEDLTDGDATDDCP